MTVHWREWERDSFSWAESDGRPVLLSLVATWCPGCRGMDQQSYANERIAAILREQFVPIRVDVDRRPDIWERYGLGGLPSTVFLTPAGEVLGGGTYVAPGRLESTLVCVAEAYRSRRSEIDTRAAAAADRRRVTPTTASPASGWSDPHLPEIDHVLAHVLTHFDPADGGFGGEPKFPHVPALAFVLERHREAPEARLRHVVTYTLDAMGEGALRDELDGGFFSQANGRAWNAPQREKLLGTNAALLHLLLEAWCEFEDPRYRVWAEETIRYVREQLNDAIGGGFYASQRADEAYYVDRGSGDGRQVSPPPVDRTLYTDANAAMASSFLRAAEVLGDPALGDLGAQALERVVLETYQPGRGVAHCLDGVRDLLVDHVRTCGALLTAHRMAGTLSHLELAQELMYHGLRELWDDRAGGFFDRRRDHEGDIGLLAETLKPFVLNCDAACVLSDLAMASGEHEFRHRAEQTLDSQAGAYGLHGPEAAAYGRALMTLRRTPSR